MATSRIPLAHNIGSRDGTLNKDSKLGNAIIEVEKKESIAAVKRPGLKTYQTLTAGEGLGIFAAGTHLLTIIGTTFYDNGVANATPVDGTGSYDFIYSVDQTQVFFKNANHGYVYTIATSTILDLQGTITTQNGTTVSGTPVVTLSASNPAIQVGQIVTGTGVPLGTYVLTIFGTALTLSQNATASGTVSLTFTTSYPATTVPGAVFVDGYYVVGTPEGLLYNSNVEDPTTWQAINYIGVVSSADPLLAIGRTINYIVTFGSFHIEFFYDAGSSPGSPFLPYQNSVIKFGVAAKSSVVQMDNTLVWMSTSYQKGFQVMTMAGQSAQVISNQYIERIINNCNPASAYAFSIKTSGHSLYVLTLRDLGYTLVYDFAQNGWTYWTSTENNVEGYFKGQYYTKYQNMDLLQHETNGKVYEFDPNTYQDDGNPIAVLARTPLVDGGDNLRKFWRSVQVVGDKIDSYALLRYTSDDYQTFSAWQNVNLNTAKSEVHRLGQGRRRAFDLLHQDNVPLRLEYFEVDVEKGDS